LDNLPIVSLNRDSGVRRLLERVCANLGIHLAVQFEVARVSTLLEMVGSGLGVSVLTELSTLHHSMPQLVAVPLVGPGLIYPIGVITPADRMLTASAAQFVKALRHQVSKENDGKKASP
jgi:DNA-binding transcriptional LysR family regulator